MLDGAAIFDKAMTPDSLGSKSTTLGESSLDNAIEGLLGQSVDNTNSEGPLQAVVEIDSVPEETVNDILNSIIDHPFLGSDRRSRLIVEPGLDQIDLNLEVRMETILRELGHDEAKRIYNVFVNRLTASDNAFYKRTANQVLEFSARILGNNEFLVVNTEDSTDQTAQELIGDNVIKSIPDAEYIAYHESKVAEVVNKYLQTRDKETTATILEDWANSLESSSPKNNNYENALVVKLYRDAVAKVRNGEWKMPTEDVDAKLFEKSENKPPVVIDNKNLVEKIFKATIDRSRDWLVKQWNGSSLYAKGGVVSMAIMSIVGLYLHMNTGTANIDDSRTNTSEGRSSQVANNSAQNLPYANIEGVSAQVERRFQQVRDELSDEVINEIVQDNSIIAENADNYVLAEIEIQEYWNRARNDPSMGCAYPQANYMAAMEILKSIRPNHTPEDVMWAQDIAISHLFSAESHRPFDPVVLEALINTLRARGRGTAVFDELNFQLEHAFVDPTCVISDNFRFALREA